MRQARTKMAIPQPGTPPPAVAAAALEAPVVVSTRACPVSGGGSVPECTVLAEGGMTEVVPGRRRAEVSRALVLAPLGSLVPADRPLEVMPFPSAV